MEENNNEETLRPENIVIGQRVDESKLILARQMRREMTPSEAKLWERLRRGNLGVNFRRQQIISGFIADFYCHQAALTVEVDGPIHDADYDRERDQIFATHGIVVLRFTNHQVQNQIGVVLYQIRQYLRTHKSNLPGISQ